MKMKPCAYCGKVAAKSEREHVFPRCLYPESKARPGLQLLTVPACRECNASWADDEPHFRAVLVLAGDPPNPARRELWPTINRSFKKEDGERRLTDLVAGMRTVRVAGAQRGMVYPGKDERVMRVVRKVIRGLSHHHELMSAVPEDHVWADLLTYPVPPALFAEMKHHCREKDVAQYSYEASKREDIDSAWLITFYERLTFIGIVFTSGVSLREPPPMNGGGASRPNGVL